MASAGGTGDQIPDQARQERAVGRSRPGRGHRGGRSARGALVARLQGAGGIDAALPYQGLTHKWDIRHLIDLARLARSVEVTSAKMIISFKSITYE